MTRSESSPASSILPYRIDVATARLDNIRDRVRAFRWDAWSEPAVVGTEAESVKQAMIEFRKTGDVALTKRFQRAQDEGEDLRSQTPADLALYILVLLAAPGLQSANGATKLELQMMVNIALNALPF